MTTRTIIKFIHDTLEYGVPKKHTDDFLSLFGRRVLDGALNIDIDILKEFDSRYRSGINNIKWTGGIDFYIDLNTASKSGIFTKIEDIEKWIEQYKYKDDTGEKEMNHTGQVGQVGTGDILTNCLTDIIINTINKSNPTIGLSVETMRQLTDLVHSILLEIHNKENSIKLDKETLDTIKSLIENKDKETINTGEYKWAVVNNSTSIKLVGVDLLDLASKALIKKALLISGVPGTGKTKCMLELALELAKDRSRIKLISLGQDNMTYSDFMIGQSNIKGVTWRPTDGIFLEMCKKADADREHLYVMCIDEIGRGKTEAVFGELITAMEQRDTVINISYNKSLLVPSNLIILATRNIRDTSVTGLDLALYERFTQVEIEPQWNDTFINEISTDSEIVDILTQVAVYMTDINDTYKKKNRSYYMVGTRVITPSSQMIGDLTKDDILDMIESQLIPVLQHEQRLNSLPAADKNSVIDIINDIKSLVEERR